MTLPASGALSFNALNAEMNRTATAQLSINDSELRTTFGQSSGAVDLSTGHGKTWTYYAPAKSIASNTTDLNIRSYLLANTAWNGTSPIVCTITVETGVWVYASSTGVYAVETGSLPAGSAVTLSLVSGARIAGRGGNGGYGSLGVGSVSGNGGDGGPAIHATSSLIIDNNGVILGGGGGGGGSGGGHFRNFTQNYDTWGGAGGGGAPLGIGGDAETVHNTSGSSGWDAGLSLFGGAGGAGHGSGGLGTTAQAGGNGGMWTDGYSNFEASGGSGSTGGARGSAVVGNSNVTWVTSGIIWGALV